MLKKWEETKAAPFPIIPRRGEVGARDEIGIPPLPFTLLDKFFNRPCSPTRVRSNRVNPLPQGERNSKVNRDV